MNLAISPLQCMAASYDSMSIQTYLHGKMSSLLPVILLITGAAHGFAPPSAATISHLHSSSVSTNSGGIITTSTSRLLSTTSSTGSDADALLDALTQTVDAATRAASTSNELAQSLSSSIHHSSSFSAHDIMTPEAITNAQSNLETLHQNLLTSTDPHVLTNTLHEALQTSITAADHALQSTSVLSYNLAHFDSVLASCIHNAHPFANMMTPEMAEIAQSKLSLLLHNLSGGNVDMDDKFITNFVSYVDTMLDGVTLNEGGRGSGDSNLVLLGAVAVVIAYSQREVGVTNYKMELRRRLQSGELNLDEVSSSFPPPSID